MIKKLILRLPILKEVAVLAYRTIKKISKNKKTTPIADGPHSYDYLARVLSEKDRDFLTINPQYAPLHQKLNNLREQQLQKWNSFVYCKGYYYQGFQKIGINGIKPTEPRIDNYQIDEYFDQNKTVLDIGSNSGFMVCYLADKFKHVTGIELNPYLIKMGEETSSFLEIKNTSFIEGNFIDYNFDKKYDVVFSLSNHFTIDGNLNTSFENYLSKIYSLLNKDGVLIFESHNINGDDSDLDQKFEIASKYFSLVKYKMVKAFYPADLDKLFAVFTKKDSIDIHPQKTNFSLLQAKNIYSY